MLTCCAELTALRELNLQGCRNIVNRRGQALPGLQQLGCLTHLVLRNCEGLQDGALLALSSITNLRYLDLSGCQKLAGAG